MRKTVVECDRCAQHPLDPARVETLGVTQRLAQRVHAGPNPASGVDVRGNLAELVSKEVLHAAAHDFDPKSTRRGGLGDDLLMPANVAPGALDLCPKCQVDFVLFMNNGRVMR